MSDIRWENVVRLIYLLENVFIHHKWYTSYYILSGIILCLILILYQKGYKSINLTELHNVEHLI